MDAILDRADPPRSEQAYEAIRNMIVSGRLRAGETISEVQLAEALAVSRTPLSTAEEYWSAWRSEIGAAGVRPLELGDRY